MITMKLSVDYIQRYGNLPRDKDLGMHPGEYMSGVDPQSLFAEKVIKVFVTFQDVGEAIWILQFKLF